jgi:hypothetical protein
MPTPQAHYACILAHYVTLAAHPAWRQYVWHRVQQMARECPELYATLPADLTAAMKQQLETTK